MGTSEKIRNLEKKLKEASSGDPVRIEKQHNAGKMTARERILTLLDSDSFIELDALVKHRTNNFELDKINIILVTTTKNKIQDHSSIIKNSGFKPSIFDADPIALTNLHQTINQDFPLQKPRLDKPCGITVKLYLQQTQKLQVKQQNLHYFLN